MIVIVMGVSGCGKSTVARALAKAAKGLFLDADDFHPPANKEKMKSGVPLNDEDRAGWLQSLVKALQQASEKHVFLACSALKQTYRQKLFFSEDVRFVYLKGSFELIEKRLKARSGHFMNPALLKSQFETLEEPSGALIIDAALPVTQIIGQTLWALGLPEKGELR